MLLFTGWKGGELVFRHRVAVRRAAALTGLIAARGDGRRGGPSHGAENIRCDGWGGICVGSARSPGTDLFWLAHRHWQLVNADVGELGRFGRRRRARVFGIERCAPVTFLAIEVWPAPIPKTPA